MGPEGDTSVPRRQSFGDFTASARDESSTPHRDNCRDRDLSPVIGDPGTVQPRRWSSGQCRVAQAAGRQEIGEAMTQVGRSAIEERALRQLKPRC